MQRAVRNKKERARFLGLWGSRGLVRSEILSGFGLTCDDALLQ